MEGGKEGGREEYHYTTTSVTHADRQTHTHTHTELLVKDGSLGQLRQTGLVHSITMYSTLRE